ncbi:NAD-dependent succinate-semialdehyde dehydrogenase [Dietzia cinnamea]|uniref:NAD-dependent succinate-semialdehyde dehydrogenase n=1 Tax=Dietzia cinnamea TaxID=321318 RepID=UPI00223AB4C9|nr:NAD-dependent succinate-semialdehyde dehydrogenase [Dietzia cinnamea]MCT2264802.1 NAD-dependent succinate-semialdehyde dehydrogenase [Dietzia cinnamea]
MYVTHDPSTGRTDREYEQIRDVDRVLDTVTEGFAIWRATDVAERARILVAIADAFDEHREELGKAITTEMGKLPDQAQGEVELAASIYRWYGEHGPALLEPESLDVPEARLNRVTYEPVGPLVGIMPWNYPYYQVARFAAPNLLLGNTVVLKHASICARSSAAIEKVQRAAGLPEDVFVNVYASSDTVAEMIADPRIKGVSLTGSEGAGAAVATVAAENLKPSVLELGGSDPLIILDADDLDELTETVGRARLSNCGQACNSPKRIFVPTQLEEDFLGGLKNLYEELTVGPAADEGTELGPLSSEDARDGVVEQVETAVRQGATLVTGGAAIDRSGAFMQPTILTGITEEMDAYREEIFGPVAMVYTYDSVDEAVRIANDTPFGLSGSVWGTDTERASEVAERLEVGMAYVNEHGTTLPGLPFGGVKRSGYGRELGRWGLTEFANVRLQRVS